MKLLRTKFKILIPVLLVITAISAAVFARQQKKILVIEELETGNVYREIPVKTGDELSFQWEHSFEHIPWYEYYEIQKDGSFILHTIAVAGFGAGIPAEMDCNTATKTDSSTWMRSKASFRSSTGSIPRQP